MMVSLFSSFDPSTSLSASLNWVSIFIILLFLPSSLTLISSSSFITNNYIVSEIYKEVSVVMSSKKMFSLILLCLFTFIALMNFMGLFPYIFTPSSHMNITLSLALPLWLGMNFFGWYSQSKHMFAHLVPQSTPGVLMPFMVMIETISNTIRPLTLAIRLSANMIAGHLLMTLLGNQLAIIGGASLVSMLGVQFALVCLEMAVSLIQGYVFCILMSLYVGELTEH